MKKFTYSESLVALALFAAIILVAASCAAKVAHGAPRCHAHAGVTHCH